MTSYRICGDYEEFFTLILIFDNIDKLLYLTLHKSLYAFLKQ